MRPGLSYKHLNKLLEDESFEPRLSWGLRMAIAAIVPVFWGLATGNLLHASWMTLTAECICWVELKGSFNQRIWVLFTGIFLALCFCILGTLTASYLWISVVAIFVVCFLSGLFKNLGDRGSGLALCVYVMFIVCNAYPVHNTNELKDRMALVLVGGLWTAAVSITGSLFSPLRQPFRRSIALIWKANASLLDAIIKGWDGNSIRNGLHDIYQKERQVRSAMDSSLQLFENRSFQTRNIPLTEQELAKLRKLSSLVGIHIVAIGEELTGVKLSEFSKTMQLKIYEALWQMKELVSKMATYTVVLKPESLLIVYAAIDKANKQIAALSEEISNAGSHQQTLKRVVQLSERAIRIMESGITHLENVGGDQPVYSSYSFLKTLFLLQPRAWIRHTKLLFNFNTLTVRYILRSSIAASIAIFIYKWFQIDHGYWLAFTVILVMQPYFGATLQKALDRIIGTLTGGIVGGFLIQLHDAFYLREIFLFISFIGMVYFVRTKYSWAAFFITVSLVLLFDVEQALNPDIIIMRAICTVGGACLGVLAGFALLPDWDSKWLPVHISSSIRNNYEYFIASFFPAKKEDWTKMKRLAETANSNAFDSFNRYLSEPAIGDRPVRGLYQIILHSVHITRELNNFNIENEVVAEHKEIMTKEQEDRVNECLYWFNEIIKILKERFPKMSVSLQENALTELKHPYTVHQAFYIGKLLTELKILHSNLNKLIVMIDEKGI